MRNLFIPEIGTEITLVQDWTFNLHEESRNHKLLNKLGYVRFPSFYTWRDEIEDNCTFMLNDEQDKEFNEIYESCHTGKMLKPRFEDMEPEREFDDDLYKSKRHAFYLKYKDVVSKDFIPHIFPTGTILKVDRIYIRKGNKDYSSLTFFVKSGQYKGQRFWAKLNDVNTMIIE